MKKSFVVFFVCSVLSFASCHKSNSSAAGSWTFEGVHYNASSAVFSALDSSLTATSSASASPGTLMCYFPSASVHSGLYHIVNYDSIPLDSSSVYLKFINGSTTYYYFSMGNDNVSAGISVSAAGKVSVTVPAVFLKSYNSPIADSSQLTANIHQL